MHLLLFILTAQLLLKPGIKQKPPLISVSHLPQMPTSSNSRISICIRFFFCLHVLYTTCPQPISQYLA